MNFFTLGYANGPGHFDHSLPTGGRRNPQGMNFMDQSFRQPATIPKSEETHGGEDVGVYAVGPHAHIFSGLYEQSYIAHGLMYASCLGPNNFLRPRQCPL
jgi:alkaline phosphatase